MSLEPVFSNKRNHSLRSPLIATKSSPHSLKIEKVSAHSNEESVRVKTKKLLKKNYQQLALLGSYWVFPGPPHPRSISVCHRFSQVIGSAAHRACNTAWICFRTFHTLCPFKMGSLVGYPVSHQRGTQQPLVEVASNISVLCLPGGVGWGTAAGSHVQKKTSQHAPGPWNHQ